METTSAVKMGFVKRTARFIKRNRVSIAILMWLLAMPSTTLWAAADPDAAWNAVFDVLKTWLPRLGGAVIFFGGIMLALSVKNDDADAKTRAVMTMVAGAIVIAVTVAMDTILG